MLSKSFIRAGLMAVHATYVPPYMTLPPVPGLPKTCRTGYINLTSGFDLWYTQFGAPLEETLKSNGTPILFLHGALASSDYWGNQIVYLLNQDPSASILAVDSRMMGRSTYGDLSTSFDVKAADTVAVLDHFGIPRAAVVGWSNGAIILNNLLMNYADRVERALVFAGNYDAVLSVNRTTDTAQYNATLAVYVARSLGEQFALSIDPDKVPAAREAYSTEFAREPHWTADDFARIPTPFWDCEIAPLVWFVEAAEEESIIKGTALQMHKWTPGSELVILPGVSHFAFLQDPETFNVILDRFLRYERKC